MRIELQGWLLGPACDSLWSSLSHQPRGSQVINILYKGFQFPSSFLQTKMDVQTAWEDTECDLNLIKT